jgi:hypothetical protein
LLDPPPTGGFTLVIANVLRQKAKTAKEDEEDEVTQHISREELKEKMDRGDEFFLVDTLEEPYYRHSHLPGAINIPLEEIERAKEVIPDKGTEIVVYCMDPP